MIGIEPGSALRLRQRIFSTWPKMAPGPPPPEKMLKRWASGCEAMISS